MTRLEFVARKTDYSGVFTFRVLAEPKDGVGRSSRLGFVLGKTDSSVIFNWSSTERPQGYKTNIKLQNQIR